MEAITIFLIVCGAIVFFIGVILGIYLDSDLFVVCAFSTCFLIPAVINHYRGPMESDLKDGKAHYVEKRVINIEGNDTTVYSTYHLEWNKGWKYGRPSEE